MRLTPLSNGTWPPFSGGTAIDVAVVDGQAFVAVQGATPNGGGTLAVVDVGDPARPIGVGRIDTAHPPSGVGALGTAVCLAEGSVGMEVIDVSHPAKPVRVGGVDTDGEALDVAVVGEFAYVADGDAGLQVIDVSNRANPRRVGGYDTPGLAMGVALNGHHAYVADGDAGLQVIDVSNPATPVRVGGIQFGDQAAYDVAVGGGFAYVAVPNLGLQVVDVSLPGSPRQVSRIDNAKGQAVAVAVAGPRVFVAEARPMNFPAGLKVIDVSDPAHPVTIADYTTGGVALGVAVSADRIYVADGPGGLVVLASLPDLQFSLRVEGAVAGAPCVLSSAPGFGTTSAWTPLYTNASPSGTFDFVDFDVKLKGHPQKLYRAEQSR